MDTLTWRPLLDINKYPDIPLHRTLYSFKYTFNGENGIKQYKNSALVNEDVTSVAIDCIKNLSLGRRAAVDMINIAYSAEPYRYAVDPDNRIELEDKYIRLDRELAKLFETIDKEIGKNVCIFVSSTGYFDNIYATEPRFNIPTGEFSSRKAVSLLNMYLMALYGNGNWVNGYHNEIVYLNEKLAKEKNIPIEQLRKIAGDFLRRMSGVVEAYTFDEILNNPASDELARLHKSVHSQESGDVFLEIAPRMANIGRFQHRQNYPFRSQCRECTLLYHRAGHCSAKSFYANRCRFVGADHLPDVKDTFAKCCPSNAARPLTSRVHRPNRIINSNHK